MNEGVHIFDRGIIDSLPELLMGTAQSLIEVDTAVTSWMDEVRQKLEQQCRVLREKEKEAQERVYAAQANLQSCEDSQEYDEEKDEYRPSCNLQRSALRRAQDIHFEIEQKCKQAESILSDCDAEISDWNKSGGAGYGGHGIAQYLQNEMAPAISKKAEEINTKIDAISNVNMGFETRDEAPCGLKPGNSRKNSDTGRCPRCGKPKGICTCDY